MPRRPDKSAISEKADPEATYITTPNGMVGQVIKQAGGVLTVKLANGTTTRYKLTTKETK